MSCSVDVSLLVYASDSSNPLHIKARNWLAAKVDEPEVLYVAWSVATSSLRISTHPRLFDAPLTPDQALGNLLSLQSLPRVRFFGEAAGFLKAYSQLTGDLPVRGNLVPDAHLATVRPARGSLSLYQRFGLQEIRFSGCATSLCLVSAVQRTQRTFSCEFPSLLVSSVTPPVISGRQLR